MSQWVGVAAAMLGDPGVLLAAAFYLLRRRDA